MDVPHATKRDFTIEATGTLWHVSIWSDEMDDADSQLLWESCLLRMEEFEQNFSRFRADSFLAQLGGKTGTVTVPEDLTAMLRIYQQLYMATDGLITPLGGQMISDLGYDASYTFMRRSVALDALPPFLDVVQIVDDQTISIEEGVTFDLGALGKGYLIDCVADILRAHPHVTRLLINAGGDIAHWSRSGERARIGLENPDDTTQAVGVYALGNGALASSASNKRRWGVDLELHHIYDPTRAKSVDAVKASWVVHARAAVADGLATSLFLAPPAALHTSFDFSYVVMDAQGGVGYSEDFADSLFLGE